MTAVADRGVRLDICPSTTSLPSLGVAALVGGEQVAVFRLGDGRVYAVQNVCPSSGADVMARGITGSRGDIPTIASPSTSRSSASRTAAASTPSTGRPSRGVDPTWRRMP